MNEYSKGNPEANMGNAEEHVAEVTRYLSEKHVTLQNDYKTPDGQYSEACGLIAADIAKLLVDIGEKPVLMSIRGPEIKEGGWIGNGPVIPKIYQGRVRWGGHTVCVCNGIVYDPMVGEPKSLSEYQEEVFMEPIEMRELISADEMDEFLSR